MKKIKCILILIFFFGFIGETHADTCGNVKEDDIVTYYASDYADVPYCSGCDDRAYFSGCSGSKNLCTSGCYPLTIASILASYGNGVVPEDVSEFLCSNNHNAACLVSYDSISNGTDIEEEFDMEMKKIGNSITSIDQALNDDYMVLASVSNKSAFANPDGGGHYVAVALKNGDSYYIINTASKGDNPERMSKWVTKDELNANVIQTVQNGLWSVKPNECNATTGEVTEPSKDYDNWQNVFPIIDGEETVDGCSTALVRRTPNGDEFTSLGQFFQDLFSLIRIATPVLVIILTTIDYIKAIVSSNADELKKTNGRTVKRLVIGILIFLLPLLLDILFDLFGLYDLSRCNIGS